MAEITSVEFEHCRELVMLPGSLFEFTSRYVPADKLQALLALYALKQTVSTIPYTVVDDSVKWAKLKWWSEEVLADPGSSSRHPVLRALWLSGAREKLGNALLLRLISDAIQQIDVVPDSNEEAMFERFSELGATDIELELALDAAEIDAESLGFLGAATSLFHIVSSFSANSEPETTRLPLGILAKYNVSAAELEQKPYPQALREIVAELAETAMAWYSRGLSGLKLSAETGNCQHLHLRWAMENRRLSAIMKDPGELLDAGKRFGPSDAWFAWRFLRQMK
jgi:phytoene/squalene synthetase